MEALAKPSILLVEDDPHTRAMIADLLKGLGTDVIEVDDGQKALQALGTCKPDLVCLDLTLPDLSGFRVCTEMRKNPGTRDIPVLVISGRSGVADRAHALEAGATEFLAKPFRSRDFMQRVTGMLNGRNVADGPGGASEVASG